MMRREVMIAFGIDVRKRVADRTVLENVIFPYYVNDNEVNRVLFVGCGWYTLVYNKTFASKEWWTIELDPRESRFGSPNHHVIDRIENITQHFRPGFFDLIICNGVFGWGLDARENVEAAFEGIHTCLGEHGTFVIGYNNIPSRCPFPISECNALSKFIPFDFPPLQTSVHAIPHSRNQHTYLFFRK